ncbi:MAG: hypothetical protein ACRENE_33115, partial [Polyangiaceae bacterium]
MLSNQNEAGSFRTPVAPWRDRAASGMRNSLPPLPPSLVAPVSSKRTISSIPPWSHLPPPPRRTSDPPPAFDDLDLKEDAATDIFGEAVTLIGKKSGFPEDESTHELERPTQRRLPSVPPLRAMPTIPPPPPLPSMTAARPLPPSGFDVLSAALAAASLAPERFTAALAQHNALVERGKTLAVRLTRRPKHLGAALTVGAATLVVALSHSPAQGKIIVDATDTVGASVDGFDVLLDGTKMHCATEPCLLPASNGLHEVQIVRGLEHPAKQAVSVASGHSTAAHFIVAAERSAESLPAAPEPPPAPEPAAVATSAPEVAPAPEPAPVAAAAPVTAPAPAPDPVVAAPRHAVASVAPAAPVAAKASPSTAAAPRGPEGYLNINSMPASPCYLDGRALGYT